LVVKKHKSILENLENWLRAYNADADGYISEPLLLIDDEADNASINTAAVGADDGHAEGRRDGCGDGDVQPDAQYWRVGGDFDGDDDAGAAKPEPKK